MAIRFHPSTFLAKAMPKKRVERLVTQKLTLNRAAVSTLMESGVLKKKTLEKIALKVIRGYRQKFGDERRQGASKMQALESALNDKKQMVQRVQNAAVYEISQEIQDQYAGEFYEWLPSDAVEPDPLHQLNYGQVFQLGVGEAPGDRYGCQCGMNILVHETKLEL
jgi:hypothetical protein